MMSVDPSQLIAQLGAAGGAPGAVPGGDPYGGQDPTQQIIWSAFPSTDPAQVAQVLGQGGTDGMHAYIDMMAADEDQLKKMQSDAIGAHANSLQAQPPAQQTPPQRGGGPGVGGGLGG